MNVPIVDIAAFYLLQLICLAVLYIRTPADAIKFLDEHPEADMRNIHSTGTYLILLLLLLNAMKEPYRMKWYVGETSEQTLADRALQHQKEAALMKEGKLATLLTHGQQALYPPGDNVRREYRRQSVAVTKTLTTTTPPRRPLHSSQGQLGGQ